MAAKATFSLRLEQLEKRFPVSTTCALGPWMLPVALMDPTRFSLELTHLGTSQVRLNAQPDTPPGITSPFSLNTTICPFQPGRMAGRGLQETWPIKLASQAPRLPSSRA